MTNISFNYSPTSFETYVSFDPAIDQDKTNIEEYMRTRDNSLLIFKPGMTPTKFYLKNIPKGIFNNMILANQNPFFQTSIAFQYGIERIENIQKTFLTDEAEIQNNGLNVWEPTELIHVAGGRSVKYISQQHMEDMFNSYTIMELGAVILKKTQSIPGVKRVYPVLATSIDVIDAMRL